MILEYIRLSHYKLELSKELMPNVALSFLSSYSVPLLTVSSSCQSHFHPSSVCVHVFLTYTFSFLFFGKKQEVACVYIMLYFILSLPCVRGLAVLVQIHLCHCFSFVCFLTAAGNCITQIYRDSFNQSLDGRMSCLQSFVIISNTTGTSYIIC